MRRIAQKGFLDRIPAKLPQNPADGAPPSPKGELGTDFPDDGQRVLHVFTDFERKASADALKAAGENRPAISRLAASPSSRRVAESS